MSPTCPTCQHENRLGLKFCTLCGSKLAGVCPSCGVAGQPDERFCGHCGTSLRPVSTSAPSSSAETIPVSSEKKHITVLFADVAGSMDLQEELEAEVWAQIMGRFVSILAEGVRQYGGTVDKFTGDGIMALFGAPLAQEDHARRACHAAWHLRKAIGEYSEELEQEQGVELHVRLGLNSGEVVVGRVGDDVTLDPTALGHTVGLAQRMEAMADPGGVLLTERTAALVDGWFELKDRGPAKVKGARDPVRVFALAGVCASPPTVRRPNASPLIGRAQQLAALRDALERARSDRSVVVGIVGEAGVGKSRLCEEFCRSVADRGYPVQRTTGVSHGQTIPLLPILTLLRICFSIADTDGPDEAREKITHRLGSRLPARHDVLPVLFDLLNVPDPDQPPPRLAPDIRLQQIFEVLPHMLQPGTRTGQAEVLILLVEDLHWFDPQSTLFLERLIQSLVGSPSLIITNFRPDFTASWMRGPAYRHVPLEPLSDTSANSLIRQLLGSDPSLATFLPLLRERTGGNPFFIEEVLRSLIEDGTLRGDAGTYALVRPVDQITVPPNVQSVLAARIDRLSPAHKDVLQTAAVIGPTFSRAVLARAVGGQYDLDAALAALGASQLVGARAAGPTADEYHFWHPLTRDVAYDSLLRQRRQRLHTAVAQAIIAVEPADRLGERAALLADHFERAGNDLQAARWHTTAATWALRRDLDESMGRWRKVLTHLARTPDTDETLRLGITTRSLLLQWGLRTGMAREEGDALLADATERADRLGDPIQQCLLHAVSGSRTAVLGALGAGATMMLQAARRADRLGEPGLMAGVWFCAWTEGLPEALDLADHAMAHCHGDPDLGVDRIGYSALGAALLARAELLARMGQLAQARESADRALNVARERAQSELVLRTLCLYPRLAFFTGEDDGFSLDRAQEALSMAETSGNMIMRLTALASAAIAHLVSHSWEAAADTVHRALQHSQRLRLSWQTADLLTQLAAAELGRSRSQAAVRVADRAVVVAVEQEARVFECAARLARARARRAAGTPAVDDRHHDLRTALQLARATGAVTFEPFIREELGWLLGDRGELHHAVDLYRHMGASGHSRRLADELSTSVVG